MKMHQGSFTIEASFYVPLILFLMVNVLNLGIHFFQESKEREANKAMKELDIVQEFYNYQILGEIGEEIPGD